MATCLHCDKWWQSWGGYDGLSDEFCSDKCEEEHSLETKNKIDYYLSHLGNSEIALLQSIVDKCGNKDLFGRLFCEVLREK